MSITFPPKKVENVSNENEISLSEENKNVDNVDDVEEIGLSKNDVIKDKPIFNNENNDEQQQEEDKKPILKKIENKIFKNQDGLKPVKFLFFNFRDKNERAIFLSFLVPPIIISIISMIHIVSFFELTNSLMLAWLLSGAFEFASISALFALSALSKINKSTIWSLFIAIVLLQIVGNVYHSFININPQDPNLLKLLSIMEINVKSLPITLQIIGILQGAILPLVSLTFVKSIVEYMRFEK